MNKGFLKKSKASNKSKALSCIILYFEFNLNIWVLNHCVSSEKNKDDIQKSICFQMIEI